MTVGASLYEPTNVFKPMGPDIGIVDGPFEYLTVGGVTLPLPFTTRMTVVRLSNGNLFLQSPIKFDEVRASELQRNGSRGHDYQHRVGQDARALANGDKAQRDVPSPRANILWHAAASIFAAARG